MNFCFQNLASFLRSQKPACILDFVAQGQKRREFLMRQNFGKNVEGQRRGDHNQAL